MVTTRAGGTSASIDPPPGNSRPGRSGWTAGPRDGGDQLLLLRCDRQPRHYHGSSRVFNPSRHVMHSINATHQMMVE